VRGCRVNGGDEGKGILIMVLYVYIYIYIYIYIYMKLNDETFGNCFKRGRRILRDKEDGGHLTNVQCNAFQNYHNESRCTMYIC
jgi:hypothetical protein